MVGGMITAPLLSMLVIPVAFRLLRQRDLKGHPNFPRRNV
jgi:Cu(I)/Ag(I) efflux system membrane protein CusA/SilA